MRVFIVLLALVATPFLASVAQSPQGSRCDNGLGDEHRSAQGQAHAHRGQCQDPPAPVPVASVDVAPSSAALDVGQTVQLTATPKDANGNTLSGRVVTWASSNESAATLNGSGLVTGVAAGPATITATSEGMSGTSAITVTAPPPAGTSVVDGTVFRAVSPWDGLSGWAIELSGTVTATGATFTATTLTNASGNYAFTGLPVGMYKVCQVDSRLQSGWQQTFPTISQTQTTCLTGLAGWSVPLPTEGSGSTANNFKNTPP